MHFLGQEQKKKRSSIFGKNALLDNPENFRKNAQKMHNWTTQSNPGLSDYAGGCSYNFEYEFLSARYIKSSKYFR